MTKVLVGSNPTSLTMFTNAINSKKQGDIGLSCAIFHYSKLGYTVSIPMTDSQDYDLLVDDNISIKRVQVKTTNFKTKSGSFAAALKTCGGNKSGNTIKKFDCSKIDLLFILTSEGDVYNIPTANLNLTSSITLGEKYIIYKLM